MGELRRITREVSTEFEIAAGIRKMSDIQGPALLFENVAGHSMPVVGGLFSTRRRALLALDVDTHADGNERFLQGLRQQIAPVVVGEGPC
jgi:4-hydroxy-3-polyprenylbenzoate decarboxylase